MDVQGYRESVFVKKVANKSRTSEATFRDVWSMWRSTEAKDTDGLTEKGVSDRLGRHYTSQRITTDWCPLSITTMHFETRRAKVNNRDLLPYYLTVLRHH